jgi:hypothetical protein
MNIKQGEAVICFLGGVGIGSLITGMLVVFVLQL